MISAQKTSVKPIVVAVLLALSFVFMGVWARMMAGSFGTFQQVYVRMLIAGILAAIVFRKSFSKDFLAGLRPKDWAIYGLRGFFANTIGVGLFTFAVIHTQLSTVSFVASLPILGLLAWLFFREHVRVITLPLIALSVVGLVMVTGVNIATLHLGVGELAAIIGMLGFDIGYLMSRMHPKQANNFQNTTIVLLLAWIPLLAVSLALHEPQTFAHVTTEGWIGLAASSVLNVAGLFAINYVFTHLKAYVAGNLLLLEGVFALIIGFMIYGEVPTSLALVGAVIILGCAYGISYLDRRQDRIEAAASAISL